MKTVVRQMGNSQGVIIPKPLLAEIGLGPNDPIDMKVKKGKIVLAPLGRSPRDGWAEDSQGAARHAARRGWSGRTGRAPTHHVSSHDPRRGLVGDARSGRAGPGADAVAYWLVVSPSELCEQLDVVTVLPVKSGRQLLPAFAFPCDNRRP